MIGMRISEDSVSPTLLPCVRIIKHPSIESGNWWETEEKYAIDIVHKDYFDTYLTKQILPFAKKFGEIVQKHHKTLDSDKAFVKGMDHDPRKNMVNRMKEKK